MKTEFDTGYYSCKIGQLAEGCESCIKGKKLVLFITGTCPRKCWYCPVSDDKFQHDVIYANETKIETPDGAISETKLCSSRGAGITGGDPLTRVKRCVEYIQRFKEEFGKGFHIHLYTSFDLVNEDNLKELFDSGLDEIRFHPEFKDKKYWNRIEIARKFLWKIGIEIPCIPDIKEETYEIIEYFKDKIDFINLNELEAADCERNEVFSRGYKSKDFYSYGIKGSEEFAIEIMRKYPGMNIHFCTSKLKNTVQLGNRIKLRAKNVKKNYDIMTPEGSLIRGAVYLSKEKKKFTKEELDMIKNKISNEFNIKDLDIDLLKNRILTSKSLIIKNKDKLKKLGYFPAIVEELATGDLFEIEIEFL